MSLKSALVLGAILGTALVADAAQQQNAYLYVYWKTSNAGPYKKFEQRLQVAQKSPASFWATLWNWSGGSTSGGYIGLQTDGSRVDGTTGDTAIFSIWDATAATGSCQAFGGEGVGYSCRLAYPINSARKYRLRLQIGTADSSGQWWNAYIRDETSFTETKIGSLRTAGMYKSFSLPSNFSEYFGAAVPTCANVPISIANWWSASLTPVSGYLAIKPTYSAPPQRGSCTGGSATTVTISYETVVKATLGGPL